jgi:hypothetical protein
MHVRALSQFLFHIISLSSAELASSLAIKELCESDRGCPVIEVFSV